LIDGVQRELNAVAHPEKGRDKEWKQLNAQLNEMHQTLSDLKSFSNAAASETEKVPINDMIDGVLELVQPMIRGGVRFEIDMPKPGPAVLGNVGLVHQAILNLFLNALESSIHGGVVSVKISEAPLPEDVNAKNEEDPKRPYVCIALTDAGLRKEQVKFDGRHGIYSTAKNNLNAGIRLTAARAIADQHRGFLVLKNVNGEKMTVLLFFPSYTA
jgi:signal transduction histidine kinase